jgi:uncharacterized protein (TIRG00374 family)
LTAILVGIAVAQLGAAVPLTPGGVGFVEGGLVAAFAALGVDLPVATAVALTYRVLETWLPSIAGCRCCCGHRRRTGMRPRTRE